MKGNFIPLPALTPMGAWNAATNTPTLGNSGAGGLKGYFYEVSVDGTTSIDGIADWKAGDWIWHNGSTWRKANHAGGGGGSYIDVDTTYTIKAVAGDFATVKEALDFLQTYSIKDGVNVTLQMDAGVYSHSVSPRIMHKDGQRIQLRGAAVVSTTLTSIASFTGSAGAYSVTLNVGDTTGMQAGDFIKVMNTTGDYGYQTVMRGMWEILTIDGATQLTIKHTHRRTTFPTFAITGGTIDCIKTTMKAVGCDGLLFMGGSLNMDNIALVGDGSVFYGVNMSDVALRSGDNNLTCGANVGISGFGNSGVGMCTGYLYAERLCVCNCGTDFAINIFGTASAYLKYSIVNGNSYGIGMRGGFADLSNIVSSGNSSYGVYMDAGGSLYSATSAICAFNARAGWWIHQGSLFAENAKAFYNVTAGGNGMGFYAGGGASIFVTNAEAIGNSTAGFQAEDNGSIIGYLTVSTSNGTDYVAKSGGFIQCAGGAVGSSFSPLPNRLGNAGAFIRTSYTAEQFPAEEKLETAARSIYVATTGNDSTGTGTIGAPYFSIHRALKDIGIIYGATVTIYIADGTYDYSALGDLVIDTRMFSGNGAASYIRIKSQANVDAAFVTEDSGTFAAQTDTQSNVHTDTSKTWVADALVGKFLRIKTMNTGSMPSAGDGVGYTNRIIPIIRNGVDWIETSFVQGSATQSQDIATYDIVSHSVVLNFGAKNIILSDTTNGTVNFMDVKITTTGRCSIGYDHTTRRAHMALWWGLYNSSLTCNTLTAIDSYIITSFVQVANYSTINITDGAAFYTTLSSTIDRFTVDGYLRDTVFRNVGANKAARMLYIDNELLIQAALQFRLKFINIKYVINACNCTSYCRYYFDTVDWFVDASFPYMAILTGSSTTPTVFANEPTLGRMTNDGTTEAKDYFNLENAFNYRLIQPSTRLGSFGLTDDGGYAIRMRNDSGVPSIKGMLASPSSAVDSGYIHTLIGATDAYGVVAEAGVADDAQALVVKSGRAAVLLEDGTAAARGQALVVSTVATGRVKAVSSPTTGTQVIGIADNDVTAGTNKLVYAQLAFKLDRAYTASDILTNDDPVKTVQQKLDELSAAGIEYMDVGINVWNDGAVLSTGSKGIRQINWNGEITAWTIIGDVPAGSIVMDVKKSTYAGYPTTASIAGTDKPTLSGAQKNTSTALTGWTKAIAAGDVLEFVIDSVSLVQKVWLILKIKRTV